MKITLAQGDDWVGIYFDEKLVHQNHSISAAQLLRLLKNSLDNIFVDEIIVNEEWLENLGHFPNNLSEVK